MPFRLNTEENKGKRSYSFIGLFQRLAAILIFTHQKLNMFNKRSRIKDLLKKETVNYEATVMGWVRTFRNNQFIALNDGSTNNNLQVLAELGKFGE